MDYSVVGIPQTRRQHYIPQFFLRGFVDNNGKLSYLQRESDRVVELKRNRSPKTLCFKRDLYETKVEGSGFLFPNDIEHRLSAMESNLKIILDSVVSDLLTVSYERPISSGRVGEIANGLSLCLAWFYCRCPEAILLYHNDVQMILDALNNVGLGTSGDIRNYFLEKTSYEGAIPAEAFRPSDIANYLATYMGVIPPDGSNEEVFEASGIVRIFKALREFSYTVLVAPGGGGFVGLDMPTMHRNEELILCWPVNKNLAVLFVDNGEHMLTKKELSAREIEDINRFSVLNGQWRFAFSENDRELASLKGLLEFDDEQN